MPERDRSIDLGHPEELVHINPVRTRDAKIWEDHAERYSLLIPLARLFRSRETAAGVVYSPGVPGGRPPTKGASYKGEHIIIYYR